ncbi:ATP-binding protein [Streptomyces sp. NPDC052107]|uniref:ATP-binding protein n=1 Tax=Streptomyces sp. NPDC052107 TaxID=3155632 RepID=UPI003425E462
MVSELVTNALRYSAPPVDLRLIKDQKLTCEVHDSGISAPRLRHARTVDEGGRGLFICAQLAQNWGPATPTTGRRSGPSKPSRHRTPSAPPTRNRGAPPASPQRTPAGISAEGPRRPCGKRRPRERRICPPGQRSACPPTH